MESVYSLYSLVVDDEFFTGSIMIRFARDGYCDIPIATTAPPTISVAMSLIHSSTEPMPRFRRSLWDRHPCSVVPYMSVAIYIAVHIPEDALTPWIQDDSWGRITTLTGSVDGGHNSRLHRSMNIGLILRSQGA